MPSSFRTRHLVILAAVAVAAVAVALSYPRGKGGTPDAGTPGAAAATPAATSPAREALGEQARTALDSGNAEFRAGRYDAALAQYRAAAAAAPQSAAPYFGVFMAAQKLNNAALADSAQREIAKRGASAGPMLGDSAMKALHSAGQPKS